jgi:hypothetical protein
MKKHTINQETTYIKKNTNRSKNKTNVGKRIENIHELQMLMIKLARTEKL